MRESAITLRIYHNPRCSKSRGALQVLQDNGVAAEVIEYLNTPPTKAELRELLRKLGMKPRDIVRTGEPVFKEKYQGRTLSDDEWLDALVADPILIERPIVVRGERAVLGRPPEKVLELI
jgi:arsenate reductase (glutaredoxin)